MHKINQSGCKNIWNCLYMVSSLLFKWTSSRLSRLSCTANQSISASDSEVLSASAEQICMSVPAAAQSPLCQHCVLCFPAAQWRSAVWCYPLITVSQRCRRHPPPTCRSRGQFPKRTLAVGGGERARVLQMRATTWERGVVTTRNQTPPLKNWTSGWKHLTVRTKK